MLFLIMMIVITWLLATASAHTNGPKDGVTRFFVILGFALCCLGVLLAAHQAQIERRARPQMNEHAR